MTQATPHPARPDDTRGPRFRYTAALADQIELKWQQRWDADQTYVVPNPGESGFDAAKPKFYCLDMFPYPSGAGLHVGHPEGYTATDIICRHKRMKGYNVLHPMGYDAFGLPAEQYAIQTGVHPAITTRSSIENFRRQLKRFGFCYDWSREVATIDPEYYKWTQWIFLRIYNAWYDPHAHRPDGGKGRARPISELIDELSRGILGIGPSGELVALAGSAASNAITGGPVGVRRWHELSPRDQRRLIDDQRLAYLGEQTVNWCPRLGTVLANDEVIDGRSERGGHPVLRKPLKQWMFRITACADRLLADLDLLDWPESTRTMQREWIGRSEGAEIDFAILSPPPGTDPALRVYTTRPDTLFGATYMVIAPEHPLVEAILRHPAPQTDAAALRAYVQAARNRSDIERQESKDKTGVFTGYYAENPATAEKIPVWTADYVLTGYGTGAIMAVPAHDERDYEFAKTFNLPIRDVIYPRLILAMRYFAEHAVEQERSPEAWVSNLADFLGLLTSLNAGAGRFDEVLERLRRRRGGHEADDAWEAAVDALLADAASGVVTRRGSTKAVWLEAIENLGLNSPADLRRRFQNAAFYAQAGAAFSGAGLAVNSTNGEVSLDGLGVDAAKEHVIEWLSSRLLGSRKVNYRLRDWTFSRQRYWGEPFPIVYDEHGDHHPVSEHALPVRLPELADYAPIESDDPLPLLAKAADWAHTTAGNAGVDSAVLPAGARVTRETNTMPGSAGSSWYFLRYCDAHNHSRFASRDAERYWMRADGGRIGGVDFYIGGSEHAVGHLLYARFWHKVLYDLGEVGTPEPFQRLFHQGLITSFSYQRPDKTLVPNDQVDEKSEGVYVERATGAPVTPVIAKMSKSLKNVVNPDDVIAEFGADTFRLYEMFMGPLEQSKPWNPRDIAGCFRFLQRAWRLCIDEETGQPRAAANPDTALEKLIHRMIAKVSADIDNLSFNTAISAMMEFVNAATSAGGQSGSPSLTRDQIGRFMLCLSPFCPHFAEEVWARLGHAGSIVTQPWPAVDPALLRDDTVELPVQIQGKVRARLMVPTGADEAAVRALALADDKVAAFLAGKTVQKVIYVPGRMVNIVAS